jgi:hypothetical protein
VHYVEEVIEGRPQYVVVEPPIGATIVCHRAGENRPPVGGLKPASHGVLGIPHFVSSLQACRLAG